MPAPLARSSSRSWNRIDGIDLLRGLSILLVLMNHVNMQLLFAHVPYTRGLPPQLVASLVWNGQAGVQIFFVVSGFLITTTSIRRWGSPGRLRIREFYLLRFSRIAPLLLALLAVLSGLHLAHIANFSIRPRVCSLPQALLAALTFHINVLEATRGYLPGPWDILWSLSVEEMFYLAFPLVARALPRRRLLLSLLGLLVLAGPLTRAHAFTTNEVWYEYSYLGGMDAIAFGCLTAMLLATQRLQPATEPLASPGLEPDTLGRSGESPEPAYRTRPVLSTRARSRGPRRTCALGWGSPQWRDPRLPLPMSPGHQPSPWSPSANQGAPALSPAMRRLLGFAGAGLLTLCLCDSRQLSHWGWDRTGVSMSILALGVALLIAATADARWSAPRILTPLRILGQRSYEIYLTHMFVVLALVAVFKQHGKPVTAVSALFLGVFLLAGLLGWLVALAYAEPANRHLRRRLRLSASSLGAAQPLVD